jgi:LAO/AO transport system kinase
MATRGGLGGLAVRTKEVCDVLDAFGRDFIIIETVGVGQVELDIAATAHSTVVVLVPESGDSIQAMKAGLMEIGELFCVNKSDREGADRLAMEIEMMVELRSSCSAAQDVGLRIQDSGLGPRRGNVAWNGWTPPVVKTVATTGSGVVELFDQLEKHRQFLADSQEIQERRRDAVRAEVRELVEQRLLRSIWQRPEVAGQLTMLVEQVMAGETTPYRAAETLRRKLVP